MRVGDVVVCINYERKPVNLTIGKQYTVIGNSMDGIKITDDKGNESYFYVNRFVMLSKYREQQLNNLLNEDN